MREARCSNCNHAIYDCVFGEYKCKKKLRTCNESELVMGCNEWEKLGAKQNDPPPEYVVRSGATFTPHVSEDGTLSWTNDKNLPNPPPVKLGGGGGGISPTVAIETIDGGHRVTITDKNGPKSFDVLADIEYIVNAVLAALGGQPSVPTVNNTPVVGMAVVGLAVVG